MNAKNFQEYLASTGRANSGLSAQARMQYGNNLNTSMNTLNAGEAAALADINRRTTDAQNAYNSGLAGANAQIEANYIQNLLNERDKELSRQLQQKAADLQERQFRESVRQFNEQMKFNRDQLNSRFSSGSGGGGGYTRTSINETQKGDTPSKKSDADIYGTFSNGYQPKGISGYGTLKKSGDTIKVGNKTQNIWKTGDGSYWYWDGSSKKYIKIPVASLKFTGGGAGRKF